MGLNVEGTMETTIFADPIGRRFKLENPLIKGIYATREIQRLKFIRQLGLVPLKYPGAMHSKFEHCIGRLEIVRELVDLLTGGGNFIADETNDKLDLQDNDRLALEVATFMKGFETGPYNMVFDNAVERLNRVGEIVKRADNFEDTFSKFSGKNLLVDHNVIDSVRSIIRPREKNDKEMAAARKYMRDRGLDFRKIEKIRLLLFGPLGAARLDFIKRDASYTGVPIGRFSTHYLRGLQIRWNKELDKPYFALPVNAVPMVESLYASRFIMYFNVYYAPEIRVAESMLGAAIYLLIKQANQRVEGLRNLNDFQLTSLLRTYFSKGEKLEDAESLVGYESATLFEPIFFLRTDILHPYYRGTLKKWATELDEFEKQAWEQHGPGSILVDYRIPRTSLMEKMISVRADGEEDVQLEDYSPAIREMLKKENTLHILGVYIKPSLAQSLPRDISEGLKDILGKVIKERGRETSNQIKRESSIWR
jgi:HD superfamily phosphohydrolase